MLIYNRLTELVAIQFIPLLLFEIAVILVLLFFFKIKPHLKTILFTMAAALVLTLLSLLTGRGFYGGMAYHEKFGWPFPFLIVSRNIEADALPAIPYQTIFDWAKFSASLAFWIFPPLMLSSNTTAPANRSFRITALSVFVILTALFSFYNTVMHSRQLLEKQDNQVSQPDHQDDEDDFSRHKLAAILKRYPQYTAYPCCQASEYPAAAHVISNGSDHYFAFITYSDDFIDVIEWADCYRVDRLFRIYQVGEFPDLADSYYGYRQVDPFNCQGVR